MLLSSSLPSSSSLNILNVIPGRKITTAGKWTTFNCPACQHLGHRPDKKSRGGIVFSGRANWIINCFNCGYKCGFTLGMPLTWKTRKFLEYCGADPNTISRWNFESIQLKDQLIELEELPEFFEKPDFPSKQLPPDWELLDQTNPVHTPYVQYLTNRGLSVDSYPYMVSPHSRNDRERDRIIIPATYENRIVGHITRQFFTKPKYMNHIPSGYMFGLDLQRPNWRVTIVVEGVLDAISISGVALMTNSISETHQYFLECLPTTKVFVPDHDSAGMQAVDHALELGYKISIPDWPPEVKDVADAVARWGKAATLASILQAATDNKIKIRISRLKYDRL